MEAAASSDAHGDEDEDGDEDGILTVLTLSVCWLWNVSILLDVDSRNSTKNDNEINRARGHYGSKRSL